MTAATKPTRNRRPATETTAQGTAKVSNPIVRVPLAGRRLKATQEAHGPMTETPTIGDRVRDVRKRRGLTQRELSAASAVSLSLVRKLEQGERQDARLETLRKLALALRVPTSSLVTGSTAEAADPQTVDSWEPVRRSLVGQVPQPDEAPTPDGVVAALDSLRPSLATNRYSEIQAILPALVRDANALNGEGRALKSRILNTAGWLLVQTHQFDAAETALHLSIDTADDRADAAAAANTVCWALLRQGRLAEAREYAIRWADDIEPRFSRATTAELSIWGRLMLSVTAAAVRDARPGEAEDALKLARAAADRIGREVISDASTTRTFGPVSVAMISAESAVISGHPDKALRVARGISGTRNGLLHPKSASRCRHRLDTANALAQLRQPQEAVAILHELRDDAPEWLAQQRYARDILSTIINRRRTLTPEMRELADFVHLPL
jgi:ribosome-binding protein aMBF1 (putative translation factor)